MAKIIRGNNDGARGGNDSYTIPGRGSNIPRPVVVREVQQGLHPNHSTYERDGVQYVRANPDTRLSNNVNE